MENKNLPYGLLGFVIGLLISRVVLYFISVYTPKNILLSHPSLFVTICSLLFAFFGILMVKFKKNG